MLAVIACLAGVLAILVVAEVLWRRKSLRGENQRKFVHILVGTFVASWPWLISWETITFLGLAMLAGTMLNKHAKVFHYLGGIKRKTYGDVLFALAIILCSLLTQERIFFALAILHVSLADGFAAVVGKNFGGHWRYTIFGQSKTVLGSMTFWFASLCILGAGVLIAHDLILYPDYVILLVALPPLLSLLENVSIKGFDNIVVPLAALLALDMAAAGNLSL